MRKKIKNYEMYEIDECGVVYSLYNNIVLKHIINTRGYAQVNLFNGKSRLLRVHRLVAETFIENPNNFDQINHKDGNRTNNHISNLEWCNCAHNIQHSYDCLGRKSPMKGKFDSLHNRSKPINQINHDNTICQQFGSASEASRQTGYCLQSIAFAARKKKLYKGFKWEYVSLDI